MIDRFDLAVGFALEITYTQERNERLLKIANHSIEKRDIRTAEKAISGITYTKERNELGMKLLKIIS